jgi:hypothetical protein
VGSVIVLAIQVVLAAHRHGDRSPAGACAHYIGDVLFFAAIHAVSLSLYPRIERQHASRR